MCPEEVHHPRSAYGVHMVAVRDFANAGQHNSLLFAGWADRAFHGPKGSGTIRLSHGEARRPAWTRASRAVAERPTARPGRRPRGTRSASSGRTGTRIRLNAGIARQSAAWPAVRQLLLVIGPGAADRVQHEGQEKEQQQRQARSECLVELQDQPALPHRPWRIRLLAISLGDRRRLPRASSGSFDSDEPRWKRKTVSRT